MSELDESVVRALPKVELHVHLEGTFPAARLAEWAEEQGVSLPRPVDQLFSITELSEFLEFLTWTVGLVNTRERVQQAAYDFASYGKENNILYAEVIINPAHWERWEIGPLVEALTAGFDRAEADGLTDCRLLLSILRSQSADEALGLVEFMGRERPRRVVGLSIDGNETAAGRTGPRFAPAFAKAREYGFGLTAHAGESSGADGVADAIDLLKADRIDHGVRAVEDPAVLKRVADLGIPLNVCISSNCLTLYGIPERHPIGELLAAGAKVTINTDDPAYMGIDLTGEYMVAARVCGWDYGAMQEAARGAVDAAFCSEARKRELREEME